MNSSFSQAQVATATLLMVLICAGLHDSPLLLGITLALLLALTATSLRRHTLTRALC
jgi:hypothetical protein